MRPRHLLLSVFSFQLFSFFSFAGPATHRWTVETSKPAATVCDAFQGETIYLEPTLVSYGAAASVSNSTLTLFWQTNGMASAWWSKPADADHSVTGRIRAIFAPTNDIGAAQYTFFIQATDTNASNYRAYGLIRMRTSPGYAPTAAPAPGYQWVSPADMQAAIDAATNSIPAARDAAITAATNPIPSWIAAATNPIPAAQAAAIAAATNPIPSWIAAATNPIPAQTAAAINAATNPIPAQTAAAINAATNPILAQTAAAINAATNPIPAQTAAAINAATNPIPAQTAAAIAAAMTPTGIAAAGGLATNTAINLGTNHLTVTTIKPVTDSTTAVRITKADGTTSVMTVDTINDRVGFGTLTPTHKTHAYNASSAQGMFNGWSTIGGAADPLSGEILFGSNASYRGRIGYTASGNTIFAIDNTYVNSFSAIQFRFGTSTKMTILGNGNTGFGTNAPAAKVHAVGSAIITEDLTVGGAINIKGTNITDMIAASTNPIPAQTAAAIANATNAIVQAGWLLYDSGSNKWLRVTVSNYSYYISEVL
jgi:hypothetical protein